MIKNIEVYVKDIVWDIDEWYIEDDGEENVNVKEFLKEEMKLTITQQELEEIRKDLKLKKLTKKDFEPGTDSYEELINFVSDKLSDITGYCHKGFKIDKIKINEKEVRKKHDMLSF
jgi:hypothetical protein